MKFLPFLVTALFIQILHYSQASKADSTDRPKWVHMRPGHAPVYESAGTHVTYHGYVFTTAFAHSDVDILGPKIIAVASSGICAFYIYKNPRYAPAHKMFQIRQEFAGSGRGIVSVTPYGAEILRTKEKGDRLRLEIVASACEGLKISAIVDLIVVTDVAVIESDEKSREKNPRSEEPRGLEKYLSSSSSSSSSPSSSSSASSSSSRIELENKFEAKR